MGLVERIVMGLALFAIATLALAATQADPVGTWRGTSLCQVHPSPCNDEQAIYHIAKAGSGYRMVMNKVVGGVEQEMGAVDAVFDPGKNTLTATTHDRHGRPGVWSFALTGDHMSGRLTIDGGATYRLIELNRDR
jgi:hypothetical protein